MAEFLSQGGYAFYVWASYGATLVLLVVELVYLRNQRRTLLARLRKLAQVRGGGV